MFVTVASFPGPHAAFCCTTKSWVGHGNEAMLLRNGYNIVTYVGVSDHTTCTGPGKEGHSGLLNLPFCWGIPASTSRG